MRGDREIKKGKKKKTGSEVGGTPLEVWTDWARKCDFQGVRTDSRPVLLLKMENRWAVNTHKPVNPSHYLPKRLEQPQRSAPVLLR